MAGALALVQMLAAFPASAAQWYELYERGLEAEARNDWQEAIELFEEAERFRPVPENRVRTYGSRFLFFYDPPYHRALCLAELGRTAEARSALAVSIAAGVTPSEDLAALGERLTRIEALLEAQAESGAGTRPSAKPEAPGSGDLPSAGAEAPEAASSGLLDVHTNPRGVRIEIDGQPGGTTPVEGVEIAAGYHQVRLIDPRTDSELVPWEQEVEVLPGERVHLEVTLARRPPVAGGERRPPEPIQAETRRPEPVSDLADAEEAPPAPTGAREPGAEAGPDAAGLPEPPSSGAVAEPSASATSDERPGPGGASAEPVSDRPAEGSPVAARWARPEVVAGVLLLALVASLVAARARGRRRRHGGPSATGAFDRRLGGRIGRYRIEDVLGRGGMATTYRARRLTDRQEVALKIPHETGDPTYAERFIREGRLGETLHHPGIVRILEAGEDDGQAFLAMELLPGHTLRELMDSAGSPLPVERCLAIVREIAEALDYAHSKGVVHRDLKPENVMVLPDGALRVMDFGVARVEGQPGLTNSQFFFGSPVYAAPELVDPRTIDHRADLYSLGVLLYELLEGEPPFVHESIFKLLEMHQREPLPGPEDLPRPLPPAVWRLVARMLAKRREARYASAQELLVDLKRLLYATPDGSTSDDAPPAGASAADGG